MSVIVTAVVSNKGVGDVSGPVPRVRIQEQNTTQQSVRCMFSDISPCDILILVRYHVTSDTGRVRAAAISGMCEQRRQGIEQMHEWAAAQHAGCSKEETTRGRLV